MSPTRTKSNTPRIKSHKAALRAGEAFVGILDWKGRIIWASATRRRLPLRVAVWSFVIDEDAERLREVFARTVALNEHHVIDVRAKNGALFRVWMWPLGSSDFAVCTLNLKIPRGLALLTEREMECLKLLGQGLASKQVAARLDISTSTIHTHLKNMREKLKLDSIDALISFAGRYASPLISPCAPLPIPDSRAK